MFWKKNRHEVDIPILMFSFAMLGVIFMIVGLLIAYGSVMDRHSAIQKGVRQSAASHTENRPMDRGDYDALVSSQLTIIEGEEKTAEQLFTSAEDFFLTAHVPSAQRGDHLNAYVAFETLRTDAIDNAEQISLLRGIMSGLNGSQ